VNDPVENHTAGPSGGPARGPLTTAAAILRRRWRKLLPVLLVLLVAGGAGQIAYARITELPEDAVLRFEDTVVTEEQLEERVEVLSALYGIQRPEGPQAEQFDRRAAKSLAVSLVLQDAAADRDVEIADAQVRRQLDRLVEQQLRGGREVFTRFLATAGIAERDVLDEIRRQMSTSELVQHVTSHVREPSDEQVRAAYTEHQGRMVTPEARRLRNIVVATEAQAQRVARAARAGQDFALLARTWSRDGSTRAKGGDLGTLTADQLDPDFAEVAFSAEEGAVFAPVQTRYGWNVGQVVNVVRPVRLSFTQVESELRAELRNRARLRMWRHYLSRLLEEADVEYADAYRPPAPEAPPAGVPD
jgi:peptidyl-prolyl cis-trans isomerase C